MGKVEEIRASELLDEYLGAAVRGKAPAADEYLKRCPHSEVERLRMALSGVDFALQFYCSTEMNDDAVRRSFERVQEIKRKRQALAAATERAQQNPLVPPGDPGGYLASILNIRDAARSGRQDRIASSAGFEVRQWNRGASSSVRNSWAVDDLTARVHQAKIATQAEALLEHAMVDVAPVNVRAVAQHLHLFVQEARLEQLDGCLVTDGEYGGILLNNDREATNERRKRFTLAHEIGHYVLHRHLKHQFEDKLGTCGSWLTDTTEREADTFASMLLLPPFLLPANFGSAKPTMAQAEEIIATFEVSRAAALRRMVGASHWRCALVVVKDSAVKWYDRSPELIDAYVRGGMHPHPATAASKLQNGEAGEKTRAQLPVSAWFEGKIADEEVEIFEEAVKLKSGYVYSLITILD